VDDAPEAHDDDQWLARQLQAGMVNITAAASFGALSTVVTSPGGGAQVGAAAATVAAVSTVVSAARERREARAVQALDAAAAVADVDLDELLNRLLADPKRTELAARALSAAAASTLETKVAALGRALATGALTADDAKVDEQLILVAVYADLEAAHVRVLAVMAEETPPVVREQWDARRNTQGWRRAQIAERLPGYGVTLEPVLAALLGHGLLLDLGTSMLGGGTAEADRLTVTESGRFCLAELAGAALQPGDIG
jgi:hypothetical protein